MKPAVLAAQVAVIPSSPPYNIQVLPGSTRQINVNITGGTLNTVNWTVLSSTGGASATFTTPAAANVAAVYAGLPTVQVNVGPGTGNCTIPEARAASGTYTVVSTASVVVQAQSVDDPTKTGAFLFNVCAKTTTVMVAPAYQQAFMGQHRTLQSWVSGDVDETGTWSIVGQPAGGNGVLADNSNRDADFAATVTGRYTLQYTSHSNPAKSATAIVYVSPNPMPPYAATPDKTEPRECYVDPALTGGDYEVGAGKQYPSLQSTPAAGSLRPGSIMRIWNTDNTGANPSTYHEYYQIGSTGTPAQPIVVCGVPDSLGNLPVIDGANATAQAGVSTDGATAGSGVISVWAGGYGRGTPYGDWQAGSAGPSYVSITGLHIVHGTPNYSYTPPGGGALTPYGGFTACLNIRSGSYIDLGGNHMDTCGLGLFTDDNGNSGWTDITQLVTMTGSHVQNAGISGDDHEHGAYVQTWYALLEGNLFDDYNPQASGADIKTRGVEGIFRYNRIASGATRVFDLVDEQDAYSYITFEGYLGLPGDASCGSQWCQGDTAGPNILAAYQESFEKDFVYGNELYGASAQKQIHYLGDQTSGMNVRNGTLYFFSNTLDAAVEIFDTGSNGDGIYGYFPGRIDARNNIFWPTLPPYNGAAIQMAFGAVSTIVMSATTNLTKTGTFTIEPPIEGAPWADNTQQGWSSQCDNVCPWPLSVPLDPHLYGLTAANYLSTLTEPYDPVTMIPPAGSAAINAGSALTGILQTMPVRRQYSTATNSLLPRLNPQTIGAVDFAPQADTPSFSPSAGDYAAAPVVTLASQTPSAAIYYTLDGSTPTYPATGTTALYAGPITVAATETVQAVAIAPGYVLSGIGSASYGVGPQAAAPVITPPGGTYNSVQTVAISGASPGAAIYYTLDGSTPTAASPVYGAPFTVSVNELVQAIAAGPGYSNSNIASAAYTIDIPQTPPPSFTPPSGHYTSTQSVAISDPAPGAAIYYTVDGSTPTAASSPYTAPIAVSASEVLSAIAIAPGDSPSAVARAAYNITAPFTGPAAVQQCNNFQQYGETVSCTLNNIAAGDALVIGIANLWSGQTGTATASSGTPVLATTDGNTLSAWILPNAGAGTNTITYTAPQNTRLWLSVVEYANTAPAPLDSAAQADLSTTWQNGAVLDTPNLTTSVASDALWAFCSQNGATPTTGTVPVAWMALPSPASSTLLVEAGDATSAGTYFGQCSGANEGEILALALKPGGSTPPAATPVLSLASGTYNSAQSVTISDATPGATIYYTMNGTTPTAASTAYTGPLTVSTSATVEAIAVSSSTSQSAIASASYIIGSQTAPSINWPTPAAITYGVRLSSAQLNATANVAGSFSYSPALGALLTAGEQTLTVTFTPSSGSSYSTATASVTLVVAKATPSISWSRPSSISYGTALGSAQLNATSNIGGSFSYTPPAGTILASGPQTLTATFTPTDSTDYSVVSATVTLNVTSPLGSPAFVQQCNQFAQFAGSISCRLSGVGAGHSLVIGVGGSASQSGRVSTTAGTPALVVKDGSLISAYLLANASGGDIEVTFTAAQNARIYLTVEEYANTAQSPLDGSASVVSKSYGSSLSTPNLDTASASDLLWSFCVAPSGSSLSAGREPIVWTKRSAPTGSGYATLVEDGPTTTSGARYGQVMGPGAAWELVTIALKP